MLHSPPSCTCVLLSSRLHLWNSTSSDTFSTPSATLYSLLHCTCVLSPPPPLHLCTLSPVCTCYVSPPSAPFGCDCRPPSAPVDSSLLRTPLSPPSAPVYTLSAVLHLCTLSPVCTVYSLPLCTCVLSPPTAPCVLPPRLHLWTLSS
uniref:Uncharacterized protein n=1 Tax=Knipowitschia caucasica TaxID=637954 RepID=A0AAV2JR22_KNICA